MWQLNSGLLLVVLIVQCVVSKPAHGRVVEDWPLEKLRLSSDLICICKVIAIKEEKNEGFDVDYCSQFRSTIEIVSMLKGPKGEITTTSLVHYGRKKLEQGKIGFLGVVNGPNFLKLTISPNPDDVAEESESSKEQLYLMYLKRRKDGSYEPVSGHDDPYFSVWKLERHGLR
jgi:hypothetical protein